MLGLWSSFKGGMLIGLNACPMELFLRRNAYVGWNACINAYGIIFKKEN